MKIARLAVAGALLCVTMASAANAQIADRRSFLHPLGFWSNDYYVAQREVYPQIRQPETRTVEFGFFAAPGPYDYSQGGGVQHEWNW